MNGRFTVIAVGAPVCLPILLPDMEPEEFARTGVSVINTNDPIANEGTLTEEQRNRSITSVSWGGSEANTGDEITLTANLNNQYENEPDMEHEEERINYFFTAKSFNCDKVVPDFTEMKWEYDNKSITDSVLGDVVKITANTKNLSNGEIIYIKIYDKSSNNDDFIFKDSVQIIDNKIDYSWKVTEQNIIRGYLMKILTEKK